MQLMIVYLFKNSAFSPENAKKLLTNISEPVKKNVMNTYEKLLAEGFELKEYEVVKKAYYKNRSATEIADWLDISLERVKLIIESIKKEKDSRKQL